MRDRLKQLYHLLVRSQNFVPPAPCREHLNSPTMRHYPHETPPSRANPEAGNGLPGPRPPVPPPHAVLLDLVLLHRVARFWRRFDRCWGRCDRFANDVPSRHRLHRRFHRLPDACAPWLRVPVIRIRNSGSKYAHLRRRYVYNNKRSPKPYKTHFAEPMVTALENFAQ